MYRHLSPLRYPGGKTSLWKYLGSVIEENKIEEAIYIEPFAGGAGAALNLLVNGYVEKIVLNDLDERIYKFWKAVLNDTDEFIARIISKPLSITEWLRQRELLRDKDFVREGSAIDVGFASFFLNRCNRSGILSAGPIGGMKQTGEWKIDARFNKTELISRIEKIAQFQKRIEIYNEDGLNFLEEYLRKMNLMKYRVLIYLDPPYFQKGRDLYKYYMKNDDHENLGNFLKKCTDFRWIISYDDINFIRNIYKGVKKNQVQMQYSAHKISIGKELLMSSKNCILPKT